MLPPFPSIQTKSLASSCVLKEWTSYEFRQMQSFVADVSPDVDDSVSNVMCAADGRSRRVVHFKKEALGFGDSKRYIRPSRNKIS